MDSEELLANVENRVAETVRDRDRLAEAVAALDEEVLQLTSQAKALAELISHFGGPASSSSTATETATRSPERSEPDPLSIRWPVGPGYEKTIKVKKLRAWSKYKMEAADWYLDALLTISLQDDHLERALGIEMAVEGAIQSLCGAFEAMICALSSSIEQLVGIPADHRTPKHLVTWSRLAAAAKVFDIDLASTLSISSALLGEHSENPEGFLAQLFLLRRRVAVQDLLVDYESDATDDEELRIDVPGRGPLLLLDYLFESRSLVEELIETISHDIADAKAGRLYIPAANELRARAEKGLGALLAPDGLLAS